MSREPDLHRLFQPATIAVAGASARRANFANRYIRQLRRFGFAGRIHAIHPTAAEVEGEPACASLADLPETVDYAYVAVPAAAAVELLAEGAGKVRFAQVMSSGFAETADGAELERRLVEAARAGGARLVGPNCLGTYCPAARVTFIEGAPAEPGAIGFASQSGGLAVDVLRSGGARGLRFSSLVTSGNSADLAPHDFLDHYVRDPQTAVIGMYLEQVGDGPRLFEALRRLGGAKPVVLLKGGSTATGGRAASSHTGAIASDQRAWRALARQTGVMLVETLAEMLDLLVLLQAPAPARTAPTERAILIGNGGGASVLGADAADRAGLSLPPTGAATLARLSELRLPPGTSVANPIDLPGGTLQREEGGQVAEILRILADGERPDALVLHLNVSVLLNAIADGELVMRRCLEALARTEAPGARRLVVLRRDGHPESAPATRELSARAAAAGLPVFAEIEDALAALGHAAAWERWRARRGR